MRALVTGATGFLGSHLVQRLRDQGHHVRALVRNPGKARVLEGMGAELAHGDVTDARSLAPALHEVDVVFHAAAMVGWAPWSAHLAATVGGTENLLAAAANAGVGRFVHISTIRVYCERYCRRHRIVSEDAPVGERGFRPFGHYARAKAMAEAVVWRFAEQMPVTILRPAWIYGPRDETIMPSMIRFLRDPISFWPGDADPCADPIHVTDVADCAIAAALHSKAIGQAFNVAPAQFIRIREFLGKICAGLGIKMVERKVPYFIANGFAHLWEACWSVGGFSTMPPVTRAGLAILTEDVRHDPAKAAREIDWHCNVNLDEGIEQTISWLREAHPEFVR